LEDVLMTVPTDPHNGLDTTTLGELNDLLALDHDAVDAYTLAASALANLGRRETVMRFRGDHERHIVELTRLIRRYGGTPVQGPHKTTGPFKLAMQGLGKVGGDRAVVLAFKTNELQVCEKYTRAATHSADWPDDVREMVTTAADDETRHYEWAESQLDSLGVPADGAAARAARVMGKAQARFADGAEALERGSRRGAAAVRRGASRLRERMPERLPETPRDRAVAVASIAAGLALLVTAGLWLNRRDRS
jgi:rubrerythrin